LDIDKQSWPSDFVPLQKQEDSSKFGASWLLAHYRAS